MALSDAVMVSRGDLGVELPAERVPALQKRIVRSCRRLGRPVIVATQMLESMIGCAMRRTVSLLQAAAIVCYTSSGHTSLRAARERPEAPILSLTPQVATARRLALVWGIHSVRIDDVADVGQMTDVACQLVRREQFAEAGQTLVAIAGMPFGEPGTTNLLGIATA